MPLPSQFTLTKDAIADAIAESLGTTHTAGERALHTTLDAMRTVLIAGGRVELRDFGTFQIFGVRGHMNKLAGKPQGDMKRVSFRASKLLMSALNPEPIVKA